MNSRRAGNWYFRLLASLAVLVASPVGAESVYVTDMLQLELYAGRDMSGAPIKKLRSGDQMELLERDGRYARVRTSEGQAGWVKSLYLVEQEPARTRVNKLEDTNNSLQATVEQLRSQLTREQERGKDSAAIAEEVESLRETNADLAAKLSAYSGSVPFTWLLAAVLLAVLAGAGAGWYFVDSRSRAKHGGYRVY